MFGIDFLGAGSFWSFFKVNPLHAPYQRKKIKINTWLKYNWIGSVVWDKAELTGDSCQQCWNTNGSGITRDTLLLSSENTVICEQMKALRANFPLCAFILTKDIVVPLIEGWILIVKIDLWWEVHNWNGHKLYVQVGRPTCSQFY